MDDKTLQYMGERVDKGRKILQSIKSLEDRLENLNSYRFSNLIFRSGNRDVYIASDEVLLFQEIKESTKEIIQKRIKTLKSEFDEI